MTQSKLGSFIEAWVNVLIGFGINFVANITVLPAMGYAVTMGAAFQIGLIFTVISVARGYVVRRWFNNYLHRKLYGTT